MRLHSNDIVIVDTSAIITRRGGGRIIDKLLKSCAKMVVSDSLLEEYLDKCRILGYSPIRFWNVRLRPLDEKGKLIRVGDEKLKLAIPRNEEDAHLANLWVTTKAKVVVTRNVSDAEALKRRYGMPYSDLKSFLDDY